MLRITYCTDGEAVTLKLEGKLLEPWTEEVQQACARVPQGVHRKGLDLSQLTFVDSTGLALLHGLIREGYEIGACSSFVAALLRIEE